MQAAIVYCFKLLEANLDRERHAINKGSNFQSQSFGEAIFFRLFGLFESIFWQISGEAYLLYATNGD